jgi:hypothetical protein
MVFCGLMARKYKILGRPKGIHVIFGSLAEWWELAAKKILLRPLVWTLPIRWSGETKFSPLVFWTAKLQLSRFSAYLACSTP